MNVEIRRDAYQEVLYEVNTYKSKGLETGGVFIGIRKSDNVLILKNILPGPNALHTKNSFEYDQLYVEQTANEYAQSHVNKDIQLLGLWHTHYDAPAIFSLPDMIINMKYTQLLEMSIVSGIVTTANGSNDLVLFEVSIDGTINKIDYKVVSM